MQTIDHSWALSIAEARGLQQQLREKLVLEDRLPPIQRVAGVDVGFEAQGTITRAAVVVLAYPSLEPLEQTLERQPTRFPYVPGLLSFRELPAVLAALEKLQTLPDLLLCDGQGIAHPRRMGIAAHLGLCVDIPSIGVAKSRLCGYHGEVPEARGEWTPLLDGQATIGAVLRSRQGVRPLYISQGHRISLATALHYVMGCVTRYRLPETTRLADHLASNRGRR